jgi:hypothetical protein
MEQLQQEMEKVKGLVEEARAYGEYTLALQKDGKKQYVLSKYQPREYAKSLLGEDFGNRQTVWILFGFCMGYSTAELLKKVGEDVNVLIIEPDEKIMKLQMDAVKENAELIQKKNIKVFSGDDMVELKAYLEEKITSVDFNNFKLKHSEVYLKDYPIFFKELLRIIDEVVIGRILNFNTRAFSRMKCNLNIIRNRHRIAECADIQPLSQKFKNMPAVIVSAGPSLKKNIHHLKNFKGIIFAMGRTMTPIIRQNVRPDFVASVDPDDVIHETFGECKEYDIPLITPCESNSSVVEGSKGEIYFLHNSAELTGLLDINVNPMFSVSGSVATLCLSSAYFMGCNPIIFIGQDLAFTDNEFHSSLSLTEAEKITNDFNPEKNGHKEIKGFWGDPVYSDGCWINILRWFENFMREQDQVTYINATEGGAYIQGAEHMTFEEAIKKYCTGQEKPTIEHKRMEREPDLDIDETLKDTLDKLKTLVNYYEKVQEFYDQLLLVTDQNKIIKLKLRIKRTDDKIIKLKRGKTITSLLMKDIGYAIASSNESKEVLNETNEERIKRIYRLNYETYGYLVREAEKMVGLIEGEIEAMEKKEEGLIETLEKE